MILREPANHVNMLFDLILQVILHSTRSVSVPHGTYRLRLDGDWQQYTNSRSFLKKLEHIELRTLV